MDQAFVRGCLIAALAASLFATKGVLVKLALVAGADATALLAVRMGLSLPAFAIAAWFAGRRRPSITAGDGLRIAICGLIGFHLASWLDVQGLRFIDVGLERVVLYLYPPIVVLLGWAMGRPRPGIILLVACGITWMGIAVSCLDQSWNGTHVGLGVALVAGSAGAYAIHLLLIDPLMHRHGGMRTMALAMCAACVGVLVHAAIGVDASVWRDQPAVLWSCGVGLAVFGTVVPALLTGSAIARIGVGPSAVIGTIGPGLTVILAWAVLGERLGIWSLIGLAITVIGGALVATGGRHAKMTRA